MDTSHFRLKVFLFLLLSVMVAGTCLFAYLENLSLLDAFYFSIVTVATVGYGDIHPTTVGGKILTVVLIITGVGTFLEVIAGIAQVMLTRRDRALRREKLNMIVGLFFSEIGTRLLRFLSEADPDVDMLARELFVSSEWNERWLAENAARVAQYPYRIDFDRANIQEVGALLEQKGETLLRLLENPTLLEHESFTELLRAVFHLRDELLNREGWVQLPEEDKRHLSGDMKRIYRMIVSQWINYMIYLGANYSYLFSLARRTNPFDRKAAVVIDE